MQIKKTDKALQLILKAELVTPMIIKSGGEGENSDSEIQKTPDGKVYINGYVIANLFYRAGVRLKNSEKFLKCIRPVDDGVSLFWTESSFIEKVIYNIVPGTKINRDTGSVSEQALYNDEVVPKGEKFDIKINFFIPDNLDCSNILDTISQCIAVINSGIENIGGLWSYGYGQINIYEANYRFIELKNKVSREKLWNFEDKEGFIQLNINNLNNENIKIGWVEFTLNFHIPNEQLFGIHSTLPIIDNLNYAHLPDNFIYRTYVKKDNNYTPMITIPGKAIRQALFSYQIERYLRSIGENICKIDNDCNCLRCQIFGSKNHRGVISITDGFIEDSPNNTAIISRVELCEHSFQNKNLFSEEFMLGGEFTSKMFIDKTSNEFYNIAYKYIKKIITWLSDTENTPPNWYRMGANSTCAGAITLRFNKNQDEVSYGI